jgi:hypothetical protein
MVLGALETLMMSLNEVRGLQSASELSRTSDRRLSVKVVPNFANKRFLWSTSMDPLRPYSLFSIPEPLLFLSSSSYELADK